MKNQQYAKRGKEIENPVIYPGLSADEDNYIIEEGDSNKQKSNILLVFIFLFLIIIVGRIFYLQAIRGEHYRDLSEKNRVKSIVIKAPRGLIKDKNGVSLAQNIPSFDLVFIPANLPEKNLEKEKVFQRLAAFLNMNDESLKSLVSQVEEKSKNSYLLKENLDNNQALLFLEKAGEFSGFYLEKSAIREYPDSEIFSHIIGYSGKINGEELDQHPGYLMTDSIGKSGIEYTYEKWLKGKHGYQKVEVDSSGNIKEELGIINPERGDTLFLNIDSALQKKSYETLKAILEENEEATAASMVAINPQNGAVLSLVNLPSYDNNLFAKGISQEDYSRIANDERKPMLNRAISGEYPPGSTFKPFIAVAALEEKVVQENTVVDCNGLISVGQWKFPDWKTHGPTDIKKAIAQSCDVYFYTVGGGWGSISGLGIERIKRYANYFDLGKITGIDLPWEANGNVPDQEWKFKKFAEKWYIGDDYHAAIGQGFITATPLQLTTGIAAIANGGKVFRPQIVDKIIDSQGQENDVVPEVIEDKFFQDNAVEVVRKGMRQTVFGDGGSGRQLQDLPKETAGKTGTAQFGANDKTHSWFVSFGPYERPTIAMTILIEGGGEGHDWAVPATKNILEWYYNNRE